TTSMRVCICRNNGTISVTMRATAATRTPTLTTTSQDSLRSWRSAITTPPTHMIGAETIIVQVSSTSICTCCTSLVVRVINDGAPNLATARDENATTRWNTTARAPRRWNTAPRRSRPTPMPVRALTQTAVTVAITWTTLTVSITPPTRTM